MDLETEITWEDECCDQDEDDEDHGEHRAHRLQLRHVVDADLGHKHQVTDVTASSHLVVHTDADHAGLPEAPDHSGGLGGREELEAGDEGRVRVPDALHSGEVIGCVNVNNTLKSKG